MKIYFLTAGLYLGVVFPAVADTKKVINLNTSVLNNTNITNQGIIDFGKNSVTLGNSVWGAIENKSNNRFLAGVGAFWVSWGWFWNAHEFGHGTRKSALGIQDTFKPKYTYNFPIFFLQTLFKPVNPVQNNLWSGNSEIAYELGADNPYVTYSGIGNSRIYALSNRGLALVAGGGFANDSQWAEHLAEQVYTQDSVHVSTTVSYTLSKILPFFYFSTQGAGDVEEISQATGVSTNAIKQASLLSTALSTSTYSMWGAMINGETYVRKQPTINGFRMPDVSAYFTHGVSYKINSGYTVSDKTYLPLAVETVTQGTLQKQSEISVGIAHTFNDTLHARVSAVYNINRKGVSLGSKLSKKINDTTTAYISAHQYDLNTMYGERNTTDFRRQKAPSVYLGVDVAF